MKLARRSFMQGIAAMVAAAFVVPVARRAVEGIRITKTISGRTFEPDKVMVRFEGDKHWTEMERDVLYFQEKIYNALKVPHKYIVGTQC
jgi:hypothetical protein